MKDYIDELIRNRVPINHGYIYVTTTDIAIPVHKVTLGISKRLIQTLELVEEMVLRIVQTGICEIDMIAGILGLPRDILDITIGDLHVKDLAYHSSGKCILLEKGKKALRELAVVKREKDVLRNVFVDAITGEISRDKVKGYTDAFIQNSKKLKHKVDANDIELYRRSTSKINQIFIDTANENLDEHQTVQDELVSIDSIEEISTGYVVVPIHIYVSENGLDIDITSRHSWQKSIAELHKGEIIDQMRKRQILSDIYVISDFYIAPNDIDNYITDASVFQRDLSLLSRCKAHDYETKAHELIFCQRKLLDYELQDFCRLVSSESKKVDIYIHDLNYWSKNSCLLTIGSFIKQSSQCNIYYNNCIPIDPQNRAINRIMQSCPNIKKERISQTNHDRWLRLVYDSKYQIDVYCKPIAVFDKAHFLPHHIAYLSIIDKE